MKFSLLKFSKASDLSKIPSRVPGCASRSKKKKIDIIPPGQLGHGGFNDHIRNDEDMNREIPLLSALGLL